MENANYDLHRHSLFQFWSSNVRYIYKNIHTHKNMLINIYICVCVYMCVCVCVCARARALVRVMTENHLICY